MNISNKLRIYRAEAKLSQQKVADALKISKSKYCRMENGQTLPDVEELSTLLSLFNITYNELANRTFPITHTIKYPNDLLDILEKTIKENSDVSENWNENRMRFNRLGEALKPIMEIRSDAMNLPELEINSIMSGTTVKTVNLDIRGEALIERCMQIQNKLSKALFG